MDTSYLRRAALSLAFLAGPIALSFGSAAQAPDQPRYDYSESPAESRLFGDYLVGAYAAEISDASASAQYFSRAFALDPQNLELGDAAIRAALAQGDYMLARTLATGVYELDNRAASARLVLAARDMQRGRYKSALKYFEADADNDIDGLLLDVLQGWALYGAGKSDDAIEKFSSVSAGNYFDWVFQIQIAIMHGEDGDYDTALAILDRAEQAGVTPLDVAMAKARIHSLSRNDDKALAVLSEFSEARGGVDSGPVAAAIAKLQSGGNLRGKRSAASFASDMIIDPVGYYFVPNNGFEAGQLYLNVALMLNPENDYGKVWLGNLMEREGRDYDAEQLYRSVEPQSDWAIFSGLSLSNLLFRAERNDEALSVLQGLQTRYDAKSLSGALALGYLIREEYDKALPIYQNIVSEKTDDELRADPEPLYFVAVCLHELDRWEEAEAAFLRALDLKPDYAEALNYLGYSWVDRGENLTEAFDMIRRAIKLEPENGAIIDSLGWAHYKRGEYDDALIHLEDAAEKEPGSATIIDHLGDVYWQKGRFTEARYQWERALTLDPTEEERDAIKRKLRVGLTVDRTAP